MAKKRKRNWPKSRFLKTGPKLKASDIRDYPTQMTDGLCEFLAWQNGGVPNLDTFLFDGPSGPDTVARVRSFDGIQKSDDVGVSDIAKTILYHWHDLPRGSVPIGDIDVAGHDFEVCTLVTFLWGDRAEKVYFFDNPHDVGELDPDDPDRLTLIAKSLPQFVCSLRSHEDFRFREVFRLSCDRKGLQLLEDALLSAGAEEFSGIAIDSRKREMNRYAYWPKQQANVYLSSGASEIYWVSLPDRASPDGCYFAIDVTKWNRSKLLAKLKTVFRSVPGWKGAKSVGITPSEPTPYWRR